MIKSEIRKKYLHKRENLSQGEVTNLSEKIFKNFTEKFALKENLKVHCFLSVFCLIVQPLPGSCQCGLLLHKFLCFGILPEGAFHG